MALTQEEKQEIIDVTKYVLGDFVRKYQRINTKYNTLKTNWNITPQAPNPKLKELTDAQLEIRFRTGRKLKAELDNVVSDLYHSLMKVDTEIMRRKDEV